MDFMKEDFWIEVAENLVGWGLRIALFIFVLYIGFRLVNKIVSLLMKKIARHDMEETLAKFISSILTFIIKIIVIIIALVVLNVPLASLSAIIGAATLSTGFALQGSLSNFAGGIIIVFFKPFKIGDFIKPHQYEAGTVEEIGILTTTILTMDNKVEIIPNSKLSSDVVTNYNQKEERRILQIFSTSYDAPVENVKKILFDICNCDEAIKEPEVFLYKQNESSLDYQIRLWLKTEDYWKVYWRINEQVKERFDKEGIEIPYNKLDVNLINGGNSEKR